MNALPPLGTIKDLFEYYPEYGIFTFRRNYNKHKEGEMADYSNKVSPWFRQLTIRGVSYDSHRIAYYVSTGFNPEEHEVYHINGDVSDNRSINLALDT